MACVFAVATEHLHFNRDRELLVDGHRFRRLAVRHDATVADRPAGSPWALLTHESIDHAEAVVAKRLLKEEVTKTVVETIVSVVANLNHAVGNAKRVAEVVARFVSTDFRGPTAEVLAVEQRPPFSLALLRLLSIGNARHQARSGNTRHKKPSIHRIRTSKNRACTIPLRAKGCDCPHREALLSCPSRHV